MLLAKDLYSASFEDLETTYCFFDCQEMGLLPRKRTKPETDFLVIGQLVQSLPQYVVSSSVFDLGKMIPWPGQSLIYLRTLCKAAK